MQLKTRGVHRIGVLLVIAVALGIAAGCGGGEESAPSSPPTTSGAQEEATTATTAAQEEAAGSTAEQAAGTDVTTIAVAAPERGNDYGWNQQGVEGAETAAEAVGAEILVADGIGYEDVGTALRQLVSEGAQFIVAHASGYNTVAPEVAVETNVPTLVSSTTEAITPGLVADIELRNQGGAYLAGVLAARMTSTDTLGIVVAADIPDFWRLAGGFVAGAKSVNPEIQIEKAVIGATSFADTAGGKRVTEALIAAGADVIFGMGDGSTLGMIQAVETASPPEGADHLWFIDIHGNKTALDENGIYLTSVYSDFAPVIEQAISDVEAGTFGTRTYELNLETGVSLLQTPHIPQDIWSDIQDIRSQVIDGAIEVPNVTTEADVSGLIDS